MKTLDHDNSAAGHYRTSGASLVAFGGAGAVFTTVLSLTRDGPLGFIDTPAALVICGVMATVGAVLYSGPRPDRRREQT